MTEPLRLVPADESIVGGDDWLDLYQCPDCMNFRPVDGKTFTMVIEEGRVSISCAVENCVGPNIDSDMLQMEPVEVTLALRKEGGSFEAPDDCDVWFDITVKKEDS